MLNFCVTLNYETHTGLERLNAYFEVNCPFKKCVFDYYRLKILSPGQHTHIPLEVTFDVWDRSTVIGQTVSWSLVWVLVCVCVCVSWHLCLVLQLGSHAWSLARSKEWEMEHLYKLCVCSCGVFVPMCVSLLDSSVVQRNSDVCYGRNVLM